MLDDMPKTAGAALIPHSDDLIEAADSPPAKRRGGIFARRERRPA